MSSITLKASCGDCGEEFPKGGNASDPCPKCGSVRRSIVVTTEAEIRGSRIMAFFKAAEELMEEGIELTEEELSLVKTPKLMRLLGLAKGSGEDLEAGRI